jgi:hypothetical protein
MLIEEVPAGDARVHRFKDIHGFPLINNHGPRFRSQPAMSMGT